MTPARFETGRAMLIGGIRRWHCFGTAASTIPSQWSDFRAHPHFRGPRAPYAYGVMCITKGDEFEYMSGLELESFDSLPPDMGRMRIPEQRYAVFVHEGHVSELPETWRQIWTEWVPTAEYVDAGTPDFERYGQEFNPDTGLGGVEIWFPVAPRQR